MVQVCWFLIKPGVFGSYRWVKGASDGICLLAGRAGCNTWTAVGNYKVHQGKVVVGPRYFKGGLSHLLESDKQPQILGNSSWCFLLATFVHLVWMLPWLQKLGNWDFSVDMLVRNSVCSHFFVEHVVVSHGRDLYWIHLPHGTLVSSPGSTVQHHYLASA